MPPNKFVLTLNAGIDPMLRLSLYEHLTKLANDSAGTITLSVEEAEAD